MLRLILLIIFSALPTLIFGFLEESEGIDPGVRVCDPEEERAAQSCKNGLTVLSATFKSIQSQHDSFTANDHIGINKNCETALTCLKIYVGCSGITQKDVDSLAQKCDYMTYLTGAFYACSQKLKGRKKKSLCAQNFFDADQSPNRSTCTGWAENRACLKWTVQDACGRSYWKQFEPYWDLRYLLLEC